MNQVPIRFKPVSQAKSYPVAWLWPSRLASGKLAMLEGDPGMGKSLVTLDLCARLTAGRPFPDGSPSQGPRHLVILDAEDDLETTIRRTALP